MPPSKSPNHLLLEEFFAAKFEFEPEFPSQKAAQFFDGAVFWDVWFHETDHLLFFRAGVEEFHIPSTTLEIGIYYDTLKVSPLTGGGEALLITHRNEGASLMITKTTEGRFSLATSLGSPT